MKAEHTKAKIVWHAIGRRQAIEPGTKDMP